MSDATTTTTRDNVKQLLRGWNENKDAAIPRNELRKLAASAGHSLEDYIVTVFTTNATTTQEPTAYDLDKFPLRRYADYILSKGYVGQGMRDQRDAEIWIRSMAKGRTNEFDLNDDGARFWKGVKSQFGRWLTSEEMKQSENQGERL